MGNLGMPETRAAQREWRNYVRNREVEHISDPADELNGQLIPMTHGMQDELTWTMIINHLGPPPLAICD
jgi:hypothetical protein